MSSNLIDLAELRQRAAAYAVERIPRLQAKVEELNMKEKELSTFILNLGQTNVANMPYSEQCRLRIRTEKVNRELTYTRDLIHNLMKELVAMEEQSVKPF